MGFFSANCRACSHPLLSPQAVDKASKNDWMADAVLISPNESILKGEYDGYGRVGEYDTEGELCSNTVYHRACWEVLGKPTSFVGHSHSARDQGWFFEDGAHAMPDPRKVPADLAPHGQIRKSAAKHAILDE